MSKSPRDVRLYLMDIIDAIQKIEAYTSKMDYEGFMRDDRTKDAVLRNLEIIGEAVKNIPEEFKMEHSDINWKAAAGMRDKLIHEYFGVSFAIVWETIKNDLPSFKLKIESILKKIHSS